MLTMRYKLYRTFVSWFKGTLPCAGSQLSLFLYLANILNIFSMLQKKSGEGGQNNKNKTSKTKCKQKPTK